MAEHSAMPIPIDREQVQELLQAGAQLIEVLHPREFAKEHIPGAINIHLRDLDRPRAEQLSRDLPVIVYCYDHL